MTRQDIKLFQALQTNLMNERDTLRCHLMKHTHIYTHENTHIVLISIEYLHANGTTLLSQHLPIRDSHFVDHVIL